MADLYVMTGSGLKKANDTFVQMQETQYTQRIGGFDRFVTQAEDIKAHSTDLEVYGRDLKPHVDDQGIKLIVGDQPFHLTEWALGQFSSKVGIPKDYAERMAKTGKHSLFLQNFKEWIDSDLAGKKLKVRTYGDHVRGVLSEDYQPVDSDILLPHMRSGLQQSNMNFKVHKGFVNPEYASIRIISDDHIDVGGDPHFVGFKVQSSDVGRSGVRVEFFVFRHACSNGMLFGKQGGILINKRHTSKDMMREGYFEEIMKEQLGRVDQLVAMTREALKDAQRYNLRDEDIQRVIDSFKVQTNFGKKKADLLFENLKQQATAYSDNLTLWSVSNALTELAQAYHVDDAEKIEDFAGDLLFSKLGMVA